MLANTSVEPTGQSRGSSPTLPRNVACPSAAALAETCLLPALAVGQKPVPAQRVTHHRCAVWWPLQVDAVSLYGQVRKNRAAAS